MRRFGLFIGLLAALSLRPVSAEDRPNIVFFLSDDHRADFLGCAGHPFLRTPHIDRLTAEGTRFQNAFVTTSICAASRATLFTGTWERTHKFTFGTPPIAAGLVRESYPALLKRQGYRTGFVGKFGVNVPENGTSEMFDSFVSLNRTPYFKPQPDGSVRHLTDITGDKAIEFVRTAARQGPFCLSVSFNAPHAEDGDKENHYPYPPAEEGLYADLMMPPPEIDTEFWKQLPEFFHHSMHRERYHWRWDTPEKYQKNVRNYFRMITGVDRNIGRVMEVIRELGLDRNTVVLFMGDNGYYKGNRGFSGKWSHYEESLRVPLVIRDPRVGAGARGQVVKHIALNVDVPATIADYAGTTPTGYQGHSLQGIVAGDAAAKTRDEFFCEHLFDQPTIPKWEGVRGSRYVYARYFENLPEGEFLHDLEVDPQQLRNFRDDPAYAEVLSDMRQRCDDLRDHYGGAYSLERFPTIKFLNRQRQESR